MGSTQVLTEACLLQVQKTKSWYGSLSRKSTASLSLQRETIKGSPLKAGSTPDFHRYDVKRNGETASLSGASQASVNAPSTLHSSGADTPTANATIDTTPTEVQTEDSKASGDGSTKQDGSAPVVPDRNSGAGADATMCDAPAAVESSQQPLASSGWLGGWFSRAPLPTTTSSDDDTIEPATPPQPETVKPVESASPIQEDTTTTTPMPTGASSNDHELSVATSQQPASSWLGYFWATKAATDGKKADPSKPTETLTDPTPVQDALAKESEPPTNTEPGSKPAAGSTWAFWSRDTPKTPGIQEQAPETGELAVVGDRSERHPKRANSTDMKDDLQSKPKEEPVKVQSDKSKSSKDSISKRFSRNRPQNTDLDSIPSRPSTPQSDIAQSKPDSPSKTKTKTPTTTTKPTPRNLLLPSFKDTYRMKESHSILKQITTFLMRTQQAPPNHVFLTKEVPKVKKAIAIGVHGLFPASFLRPMIGQPTGTSLKFANHCADSIRRWADAHGCGDCEIEKVALEGEGKIDYRVTNLWSLLQNWLDHIREADLVMIACHSQGVPVAMMLLEKLIDCSAVGNAKIGVCAMAGVNLGPFAEYKSSMGILMGSAAELWEFANSESDVSKKYETALKKALQYGVRVSYVGSIDDQLSAIFSPVNHPYVYRAVFVDGRIHASDFITHLVGFACKLRNLGVSDHGLIRELSMSLAGSLYGGEGHSRLYEDVQVYDLAISHTLETTDIGTVACEIARYEGLTQPNPFVLPWIMRGLLEEDFVKTELSAETDKLLQRFDEWKPTTKPLQNVKYRLEAVRSKL
ncbi:hypothetical protein BD289DRAFT_501230 [Coniella lustricola]|uniref:YMC020W-like alpha/beta hydrolase domain-containing protein n=1 Tax=Coniella lustricola TaxID=2025994 RepID=A0A2T3AKG9_9PEZI|nr:hypothetical protein BD289DRAFT_501230 [Coniella lustricola]